MVGRLGPHTQEPTQPASQLARYLKHLLYVHGDQRLGEGPKLVGADDGGQGPVLHVLQDNVLHTRHQTALTQNDEVQLPRGTYPWLALY